MVLTYFKRPGGKLTEGQEREIKRLQDVEAEVFVCFSAQDVKEALTYGSIVGLYPSEK